MSSNPMSQSAPRTESLPNQPAGGMDAEAFKSRVRAQWDRSARGWNDHSAAIREWLRPATEAMLEMASVVRGARVLDVAAGSGDQTLDVARRVGPEGRVLATDLSPAIIALAQQNAATAGLRNVSTKVADGEDLGVEAGGFDSAVCRLGLMLFPDPRRALRELPPRDPAQPGGLLSLGRLGLLDEMFRDAGFTDVATTALDAPFRLPSVAHYIDFVRASASPIQQILGGLDPTAAQAAWHDIETRLSRFNTVDDWVGPNELLLTAARR
jgi:SAM-dependent methyltransferase